MPAGEPTWVTTRVTNTGLDDLVWFHDGCSITVGVGGLVDDAGWRSGVAQLNPAATWKSFLLDVQGGRTEDVRVDFTPEAFVGRGSFGCADIGIADRIRPGRSIEQRAEWNGLAYRELIPPPTGHVGLVGTFRYSWRASEGDLGQVDDISSRTIDVHLDAWVESDGPAFLHPGEAVDAALLDPRLTSVLADVTLYSGTEPVLRYVPKTRLYEIGILESGDLPAVPARVHLAHVDAVTGRIVAFEERVWDYDVDGFP
jgi:hypothetical protein